jgi:hypothetical protein
VDAYGFPIDEFTRAWDRVVWPLTVNDRDLSPRVQSACHALAVDEQRRSFEPMLWNEKGSAEKRIHQVWFPGVHSDVGGGYPDDALALVSLNWMLGHAAEAGLEFIPDELERFREQASWQGPQRNSRSGLGAIYRFAPRDVDALCREQKPGLASIIKRFFRIQINPNEVLIDTPKLHHSVFRRIEHHGDHYAPINLPRHYAVIDDQGNLLQQPPSPQDSAPWPEDSGTAATRAEGQALVWALVWQRKLVYLLTLCFAALFVVFPYIAESRIIHIDRGIADAVAPYVGTLGTALTAIPGLVGSIPGLGFAAAWAEDYAAYPAAFGSGALILALLLVWSNFLQVRSRNEMQGHLSSITRVDYRQPVRNGPWRRALRRFFEGRLFRSWILRGFTGGLELIAIAVLFYLLLAASSHLAFTVQDGLGMICDEDPGRRADPGSVIRFDPKDYCYDTGLELKRGATYFVTVKVYDWGDSGVEADARGCIDAPFWLHLATPLRRHYFADWYQPVARIRDSLFDRYPLASTQAVSTGRKPYEDTVVMNFKARRTGRLFLYLNDAVLFHPALVRGFYANNQGQACLVMLEGKGSEEEKKMQLKAIGETCDPRRMPKESDPDR